ncbi:IS66 family insertion sequence element accessory protein TnpB [Persicobacter diffluens]|uniref:Transposase n=1 Tax=Persicobacter diffluens TaxID=981 RepID=A0AAN5ANC3_9BACT|nr:transposase [Persicobacter diffluens]GJM65084.1 transposase [Persicobacter diffluens]
MLAIGPNDRLYLFHEPTDMRKGFDGLSGLVRNHLKENPLDGNIYIFINKSRDRIKLLRFEGDGFAIYYKRLESGRIELPPRVNEEKKVKIDHATIMMMLQGIGLMQCKKYKRFSFSSVHKRSF